MERLEKVLSRNFIIRRAWNRRDEFTYILGTTPIVFLSGNPFAGMVGHTDHILLSVDKAQAVDPRRFDTTFAPMAVRNAAPSAGVVGHTAHILLPVDKAQAIDPHCFDTTFSSMAARNAAPFASGVGHTAHILLSIDVAQAFVPIRFDTTFPPMAAAQNATPSRQLPFSMCHWGQNDREALLSPEGTSYPEGIPEGVSNPPTPFSPRLR